MTQMPAKVRVRYAHDSSLAKHIHWSPDGKQLVITIGGLVHLLDVEGTAEPTLLPRVQDKLDHLGKMRLDWHQVYMAQLTNVADDPIERDKLIEESREFNATNDRLQRESHETYDPIIADLQRRIREAKAAGAIGI